MATLKVRCPNCDASIRRNIEAVDEPTDLSLTCPKCGIEFTAIAEPEAAPPKQDRKPIKTSKRRDDEDDEETPRKKKKKKQESRSNTPLIAGVAGGILLLIGGVVAAVLAFGGSKDKGKDTVKADSSPSQSSGQMPGGPNPGPSYGPGQRPTPGSGNTSPNTSTPTNPSTNSPTGPGQATGPTGPGAALNQNPGTTSPAAGPGPKKNSNEDANLPPLPPPPKLRLHGPEASVGGTIESTDKPRLTVPLSPDEDPFVRARTFRIEGTPPPLPKLPPVNQRPVLALDSGGHTAFIRNVFIAPAIYKITDQTFAGLKSASASDAVLTKLTPLKNKEFTRGDLMAEIYKALSPDEMKQFRSLIEKLAATPIEERVITVGEDKAVRVWDIKSGTTINTIRLPAGVGEEGSLQAAALSPKGNRLAVGGISLKTAKPNAYPIFIINLETGALIKTINTSFNAVQSLHFSSEGNRLAAGSSTGTVQVFDVNTGAQVDRSDPPIELPVMEVRFNPTPKSRVLAVLYANATIRVVDLSNPSRSATLKASDIKPITLAWSNDAKFIAVGGHSGDIRIFNAGDGTELRTIPNRTHLGHTVGMSQIQFLPGDREFVCGGSAGWAGVIERDTGKVKVAFTQNSNTIHAVACSVDGKSIATCGGNQNEVYVWSSADGKVISRLCGAGKGIWGIGWAKDGKSIGWGTKNKVEDVDGNCPLEEIFRLDDLGPGGPSFQTRFQQQLTTDETYTAVLIPFRNTRTNEVRKKLVITIGKNAPREMPDLPGGEPIMSLSVLPGRGKVVIGGSQSLYLADPQTMELKQMVGTTGSTLSIAPSPDGKYFVTGSSDQIIRIWQLEMEEPVMSIFIAGRDWVAWTQEGFYACSSHGEQLLAWQINNTAYKMPQVFPAARFRASLYQPAIIKYLIPAGRLQFAMAMAQKFDKALVQTTSVADVLPPQATLDASIAEDLIIDRDSFTIKASAKGSEKQPITAMRLLVDGRPFQGTKGIKRFDTPSETAEALWDVPFSPGQHSVAVIAETAVSRGMTKTATITRKGEVPKPNLYMLAMGISDYPGDMKLNFAASDAVLLADTFQTKCRGAFANIEVRVLTDKLATRKGIQNGLDWLASKMTAKDVGIVSFSGHGTRDPNNKFYLVTYDIDPRDPFHTCLAGEELKSRLDNMPGRLVAILDACHSGDVAERVRPPVSSDSLVQDLASEDSGVVVMCASLGREYSLESKISKAGFFTLGIVEGLSGWADIDEDGVVNISELDKFALARVRQLSHGQQNSIISLPPGIRPFPLATVSKSQ